MGSEEDAKKAEKVDREELALRTEFASTGRAALIKKWWELARPRREGDVPALPVGAREEFFPLFRHWLRSRCAEDALVRCHDVGPWAVFRYARTPVVQDEPGWETAWHGTWWYALWMLLETGVMLESNDRSLGHDFTDVAGPGVYCSPVLETARWYARPTVVFNDGAWHKVMLELKVDPKRRRKERARGGVQWVFASDAVALKAVWVLINAPPKRGDERVREWTPELEALPPGHSIPEATVNPRSKTEPWPSSTLMATMDPWEAEEESTTQIPTVEQRLGIFGVGSKSSSQPLKKPGRLHISLVGQPSQKDGPRKPSVISSCPPAWAVSTGRLEVSPSIQDSGIKCENTFGDSIWGSDAKAKRLGIRLPLIQQLTKQPAKLATKLTSLSAKMPSRLGLALMPARNANIADLPLLKSDTELMQWQARVLKRQSEDNICAGEGDGAPNVKRVCFGLQKNLQKN